MKENIFKYVCITIFLGAIIGLYFYCAKYFVFPKYSEASLVVFGDNIATDYKPFVENDGIYIMIK